MAKEYLGDGVYCDYNGYQLVLTVENGHSITNTIYVDDAVWLSLVDYVRRNQGKEST